MRNRIVTLLFALVSLFSIAFLSASSVKACGPGETECNNGCGYYCRPAGQSCPCSPSSSGGGGGGSAPAPAPAQVFGSCDGQPIGSEHRNAGNGCFYTCTSGGWSGPNRCDGQGNGQYQGEAATTVAERQAQAEQVALRNQEAQQVVAAQGIAQTAIIAGQTAEQRKAEADKQRSMVQAQTTEAIKAIQESGLTDAEKAKQIAAITAASNQALVLVNQAAGVASSAPRSSGSRVAGVITGKTALGIECSAGSQCISGNCQLPSSLGENETAGAKVCSLNIDNYDGEVAGKFYCEKLGRYVDSPTTALVTGGQSACNAAYAVEYSKGRVAATKKNDWDSCTLSSECKNSFCNNGICGSVDCNSTGSCTVKSIVCTGNKCDVNLNKEVTVQDLRVQADKEKQIISVIDSKQTSLVDETLGTVISTVNKAQAASKCNPLWQTSVQKCEFATSSVCEVVDGCPQPKSQNTTIKELATNGSSCTSSLGCGTGLHCVDIQGKKTCQPGSVKGQPNVATECANSPDIEKCWCTGRDGVNISINPGSKCPGDVALVSQTCDPLNKNSCFPPYVCVQPASGGIAKCEVPKLPPTLTPGATDICSHTLGCYCASAAKGVVPNGQRCPAAAAAQVKYRFNQTSLTCDKCEDPNARGCDYTDPSLCGRANPLVNTVWVQKARSTRDSTYYYCEQCPADGAPGCKPWAQCQNELPKTTVTRAPTSECNPDIDNSCGSANLVCVRKDDIPTYICVQKRGDKPSIKEGDTCGADKDLCYCRNASGGVIAATEVCPKEMVKTAPVQDKCDENSGRFSSEPDCAALHADLGCSLGTDGCYVGKLDSSRTEEQQNPKTVAERAVEAAGTVVSTVQRVVTNTVTTIRSFFSGLFGKSLEYGVKCNASNGFPADSSNKCLNVAPGNGCYQDKADGCWYPNKSTSTENLINSGTQGGTVSTGAQPTCPTADAFKDPAACKSANGNRDCMDIGNGCYLTCLDNGAVLGDNQRCCSNHAGVLNQSDPKIYCLQ